MPALRTLGNIAKGDDDQTQTIIDASVLPCLSALMNDSDAAIRKEACWIVSNITAGNEDQIQAVLEAGIVEALVRHLGEAKPDIIREAVYALSNVTLNGTTQQIDVLARRHALKTLDTRGRCDIRLPSQVSPDCVSALSQLSTAADATTAQRAHETRASILANNDTVPEKTVTAGQSSAPRQDI